MSISRARQACCTLRCWSGRESAKTDHWHGRIRTFEGISHQIYSLTPLATWVHARASESEYRSQPFIFKIGPGSNTP